jgi:hypothetical protein
MRSAFERARFLGRFHHGKERLDTAKSGHARLMPDQPQSGHDPSIRVGSAIPTVVLAGALKPFDPQHQSAKE